MNKKRLLKLAEFLENEVPRKRFDMGQWGGHSGFHENKCGSAACALGWATTIPAFRRAGLIFSERGIPTFEGEWGEDAGARFFNLPRGQATTLFMPGSYPNHRATPKQVAKRIRKLVAGAA